MRIIVDGRLVEVKEHATVSEIRSDLKIDPAENLVEVSGTRAELKEESDMLKDGGRYIKIPPVVQGCYCNPFLH